MKPLRYPIRAVSKLTGVPVDTLRAWERRYRAVEPARDARGRVYSADDVERLRLLRRAVDAGHAIGRVAALPTDDLRRLVGDAREPPPAGRAVELSAVVDAIDRLDATTFRRELSRLAAVLPVKAFCAEVALPLLHLVGEGWHAGTLSVAQEHLASAEVRSLLGALARLHEPRRDAPTLVFATPAGELHEIGTLAAALVAADAGLGALYLGANVPAPDVLSAVSRTGAAAVVLGWTGAPDGARNDALSAIGQIAGGLPRSVELWIGGEGARAASRATGGRAAGLADFDAYEKALARLTAR